LENIGLTEQPPSRIKEISINKGHFLKDSFTNLRNLLLGKAAKRGYLSTIDQAIISLANFAASIFIARVAIQTEFGIFSVGLDAVHLVRAVQEGVIITPLNTFGAPMEKEEFKKYASSSVLFQLALAILSAIAAAALGYILIITGNDKAGPAIFALWFLFSTWQLQEYFRRLLYTRGRVGAAIINTIITNVIRLAYMVWVNLHGGITGIEGLNAVAWGSLAGAILGVWQGREYWTKELGKPYETWLRDWKFGRWMLGGTIANWMTLEFYPIMAAGIVNFAAAGAYNAIQNLVAPIHLLLRATDTFLMPHSAKEYARTGHKGARRSMNLAYIFTGIPIVLMLVFVSIFAKPLLHLLYGDTYINVAAGVPLMALFYFLWFLYWPLQVAFKSSHSSRPIFIANIAAVVSMFTLGVWAIYKWNLYGTIAGQALNSLIVCIVLWTFWRKLRRSRASETK
jgi:O-antigen/teichoic acid export membrane protein